MTKVAPSCRIRLVVDPHRHQAIAVEDPDGSHLGLVTPLDAKANVHRKRCQPQPGASVNPPTTSPIEDLYQDYCRLVSLTR